MKVYRIDEKQAKSAFRGLSQKYKVIAPVEKVGKGTFSNTALATYADVRGFDEIEFFKKTHFSAKAVLFPVRERMFEFHGDEAVDKEEEIQPAIVCLRSCDIHAVSVMDAQFLKAGGREDPYYKRRRDAVKFFLMECAAPFENCFCVSMGTNKTEDYAAFMRRTEDGYEVGVKDAEFEKYFSLAKGREGGPGFVEKDTAVLRVPEEIGASVFEHGMWKEYSGRCIACGRCNTSCPTCTCFTIQDMPAEEDGAASRTRIWSSCQVKNFGLLAGHHDFRIPRGDRMRYRVLHKINDFKKKNGFHMCVGCGRCDDVCPEYISMFRCVEKIHGIIETGKDGV